MKPFVSRRTVLKTLTTAAPLASLATLAAAGPSTARADDAPVRRKGNINHSVCGWCYKWSLDEICRHAKALGIASIDLCNSGQWPTLKKYGLTCAMGSEAGMGIGKGFNRIENHDRLVTDFEKFIPKAAAAGIPSVICMSGNREGLDDQEGVRNCVIGLKRLMKCAEKHRVNVVMELLNSKVDHHDYQCDHTAWGVAVCKGVGSERMKLLYDIYHMQIMEGDVIRNIRDNIQYIAHFHTGGVPGRNEIDDTQELYYPAIMKAIVATGYKGYVAQEFIPRRDPLKSLAQSIDICDV